MAKGKTKRKEKHMSLFWGALDRLTAFIYSLFTQGRIGDMLLSRNTLSKKSLIGSTVNEYNMSPSKKGFDCISPMIENNALVKAVSFVRTFFASLKMYVYGAFFVFYGLSASVSYYISSFINGSSSGGFGAIVTSVTVTICAIPLLFSGSTAVEVISGSKFMCKIVLDFLYIPEEKLKIKKRYGSTSHVFFAVILAIFLGMLTYFIHSMYIPIIFAFAVFLFLVFANPETGVILTVTVVPFLQYFSFSDGILIFFVTATGLSYLCKVLQRRRTVSIGPESVMLFMFCGFILAAGAFSIGGAETFGDAVTAVILILGGFFVTSNLIHSKKSLGICTKALAVSLVVLSLVGLIDAYYSGISQKIIETVGTDLASIAEKNFIFPVDSAEVFGMMTVLVYPLLFAYTAKQKTVKGAVAVIILAVTSLLSAWMYSRYEIIVAMLIEICLFWVLYSHKTMAAVIVATVPAVTLILLYPYGMEYLGLPDISDILTEYMPACLPSSSVHTATVSSTWNMISDGHLGGIGAGEHVFSVLHPTYANAVSVGASDPTSLWLQVICWSGMFGFATFLLFIMFLAKRSLGFLIDPVHRKFKGKVLALFCGIATLLLLGMVYSVWSDMRILYLFFTCTGMLMGYINAGDADNEEKMARMHGDCNSSEAELIFNK